jgi:DNA polymerase elongation subunit (family B)
MSKYLVVDIETLERPMPLEMLADGIKKIEERNKGKYKNESTIQSHNAEDIDALKDKWKFSKGGAQLLAVGWLGLEDTNRGHDMPSAFCTASGVESEVVKDFVGLLDMHKPQYLVAYNGNGFDFPILTAAMIRNNIFPSHPMNQRNWIDLMRWPFSFHDKKYESLESLATAYQVAWPSNAIEGFPDPDGSQVAAMWQADLDDGRSKKRIEAYCTQDVTVTAEILAKILRIVQL